VFLLLLRLRFVFSRLLWFGTILMLGLWPCTLRPFGVTLMLLDLLSGGGLLPFPSRRARLLLLLLR
jgi:hypothetical protein